MKLRNSILLLAVALGSASAATAHGRGCSDSTIKGEYAFAIHGQILTPGGPLVVDGIAKTTFDGNGNFTQVDTVAVNGFITQVWRPGTGTYTLNSDCTGTMTLMNQGDPAPLHLAIVVSQSGAIIHDVVTDPGVAVTADAERVVASDDRD
jgi:hypothetical protein